MDCAVAANFPFSAVKASACLRNRLDFLRKKVVSVAFQTSNHLWQMKTTKLLAGRAAAAATAHLISWSGRVYRMASGMHPPMNLTWKRKSYQQRLTQLHPAAVGVTARLEWKEGSKLLKATGMSHLKPMKTVMSNWRKRKMTQTRLIRSIHLRS